MPNELYANCGGRLTEFFLGSYDSDPWSEQRCAHRRSDTILSDGGTNEKDG